MSESEREPRASRDEKEEKEEKDEKGRDRSWEEKWRDDPVNAASWAAILIWAGIALLIENLGWLRGVEQIEGWNLIFIGAGLIVLVTVAVRLLVPAYRRPVMGSLIFGLVLLAIGLGEVIQWSARWPLIIIAIGVGLLARGLSKRQ